MDSERTRMTAHRLGATDEVDAARRSRTYTAISAIPRARLNGISQKSSADTMEGNTSKNHTSDNTFKANVEAPIHVAQITTGRGLLRPGIGVAAMRPDPRVIHPTPESSRKARTATSATSTEPSRSDASFLIIGASKWSLKLAGPERPPSRPTSSRRVRQLGARQPQVGLPRLRLANGFRASFRSGSDSRGSPLVDGHRRLDLVEGGST